MARPLKVLVVEDMLTIRLLLSGLLKPALRGQTFVILEAENGEEGLVKARQEHPDIVVTDVAMPRMDGVTLCRLLKADPGTSSAAVVMVTSDDQHREAGLAAGAVAFLRKPIRGADLQSAMQVALTCVPGGTDATA